LFTTTTYDPIFGQVQTIAAPDGTTSRTFYPVGDYRAGQIQSVRV
jgi:hypothetical protein